ncbi:glycosyltransferase family 9 protein [Thermomicrobium sp. CFH 73360]|uniref:glycosyltransferase family 9 protein n=1 Tax=Thermomicrobium sp. CFH 73360 TaxID=2951987 RepID=UPI0020779BDE|nr:glycosyltransferase family 9 protein [Thermomicrobium sp. CFH 73360]MCM8747112.1 glycosyltransferase family 9 protein [Thermomicrobium sp. CFH 73360]
MPARFRRILVIKIADLGDAVLTLPALRALRRAYPDTSIDVLTSRVGAELYALCPAIDHVYVLEKSRLRRGQVHHLLHLLITLRRHQYDAVLLLHHLTTQPGRLLYRILLASTGSPVRAGIDNGTGHFLTHRVTDRGFGAVPEWRYALEIAQALGALEAPDPPFLQVPVEARRQAQRLLKSAFRPYVVIHPGVGPFAPARRWPAERFAAVARELARHQLGIVVTGTTAEKPDAAPLLNIEGVHDLIGRTDIATLAAVLEQASLVLGSDCGVVHLAAALGRPTLALFGPTNVEAWRPLGSSIANPLQAAHVTSPVLALTVQLPCSPCCYVGYRVGRPEGCSLRTCLTLLTPELVTDAALRLLDHC